MRPRTPSIIWLPFVFSIGGVSWVLLVASMALLAGLIVTPAIRDLKVAEAQRNEMQASVALLDQQIALQKQFMKDVNHPMVLVRLAERQFNVTPPGQQILPLDPAAAHMDRSVDTMLHQSLTSVEPKAVEPLPLALQATLDPKLRPLLLCIALAGLACSFLLGVKFDRNTA